MWHFTRTLDLDFDAALARTVEALAAEGFGVLSEIDVKAKLDEKLGVDFRRYRILGACNPPLAHRALELDDKVGLLMPCNVVVQERADGRVEVSAVDPQAMLAPAGLAALQEIAADAAPKLRRVIESL